jgi:hypothetical protein
MQRNQYLENSRCEKDFLAMTIFDRHNCVKMICVNSLEQEDVCVTHESFVRHLNTFRSEKQTLFLNLDRG